MFTPSISGLQCQQISSCRTSQPPSFRAPTREQRLLPTTALLLLRQPLTKPSPPSLLCTVTFNYLFSGGLLMQPQLVTLPTQEFKKLQKAAALRQDSRLCHCHRAQLTAHGLLKHQLLQLYFRSPKTCFMNSCHGSAKSVEVQGNCSESEAPGSPLPPASPGSSRHQQRRQGHTCAVGQV